MSGEDPEHYLTSAFSFPFLQIPYLASCSLALPPSSPHPRLRNASLSLDEIIHSPSLPALSSSFLPSIPLVSFSLSVLSSCLLTGFPLLHHRLPFSPYSLHPFLSILLLISFPRHFSGFYCLLSPIFGLSLSTIYLFVSFFLWTLSLFSSFFIIPYFS